MFLSVPNGLPVKYSLMTHSQASILSIDFVSDNGLPQSIFSDNLRGGG